ncbi:MAG TPA: PA14 domain-containing protein, partial [Steroidobacteraceae bacterium]|nr:PA14 domain-containing protein [Steroidobacteraceae bacterium]
LGTPKSGISADLDALAAYLASLTSFPNSPYRNADGTLTAAAMSGRTVFQNSGCGTCHSGTKFTGSAAATLMNVGTIDAATGQRLGSALTGLDPPTLRDVWSSAPYLHDGSAATLADAVRAHTNGTVKDTDLALLVEYVRQIGAEEATAPGSPAGGLTGRYFGNTTLSGAPVLIRNEAVNFNWGSGSPGTGVGSDYFSVRWTGDVVPTTTGNYRFRTSSDDGVRLWVNGVQVINNWTLHSATDNTSGTIRLNANTRYSIRMEYYEQGGNSVAKLQWLRPGTLAYQVIPATQLLGN